MQYQGKELTEYKPTETVLFNPPKKMLVWDSNSREPTENDVVAFITSREYFPVVTVKHTWMYCAEFPKVPELELVTYRELARWLAEGNGEVMWANNVLSNWNYSTDEENKALDESLSVRKWDDTEWHKPTREYLGLED